MIGDNKRNTNMISETPQKFCHPDRSGAKASEVESLPRASEACRGGPAFFFCSALIHQLRLSPQRLASFCLFALLTLSAACNRPTSQPTTANSQLAAKRYPLKGKVVSLDKQAGAANINNEPIPGFMDAMIMPYPIKPAAALEQLQPGDSITADVVIAEPGKYWLENVKITAHGKPASGK
jgi:Cu/Ag efflux protein CusF